MIHIPEIIDYKPFYIQTASMSSAKDIKSYGLIAKSTPFPILPSPKDPYKNDWLDENGDDEYVSVMHYKPIEFTVAFYLKAYDETGSSAEQQLRQRIDDFFSLIRDGEFKIYDSYTGIGRQKVRYAGYEEESFKRRDNWARVIFHIKFKVNDPITRIIKSGNQLTEE